MRVFIKADNRGIPESEIEYTAWQGFQLLGIMPVFYQSDEELKDCTPADLVVGGISTITRKMAEYGIQIEDYDYPEELSAYLGRRIWRDTLDSVLVKKETWPIFVKPVRDKRFTGFVLRSEKDVPRLSRTKPNEPVQCSELVSFASEWRAYVRYGRIFDVRPYKGDWRNHYDADMLESAVKAFKSAPAGYSMDIGLTEEGQTLLVEVNDGFALGTYGTDAVEYAKLLSARWCELAGIHDECDQYFEAVDWKKNKPSAYGQAAEGMQEQIRPQDR